MAILDSLWRKLCTKLMPVGAESAAGEETRSSLERESHFCKAGWLIWEKAFLEARGI